MNADALRDMTWRIDEHVGKLRTMADRPDVTPLEILAALLETTCFLGLLSMHLSQQQDRLLAELRGWA